MNRATFIRFRIGGSVAIKAALVGVLLTLVATPSLAQTVADKYQRMRDKDRESGFELFAEPTTVLRVNQYQCGLRNQGDTCSDVFNSPTGGGGFWPTGSSNQYMFNGGLNMAGMIPADAGFAWAGDTTGAYFMDARGTQQHGEGLSNIYNSLDPNDIAEWPDFGTFPNFPDVTAYVVDPTLYNPVLLGREAASQQDTWVIYWDGNPAFSANRTHPAGFLVEQRSLAWNYPGGNEATVYFIYKFTNITNNAFFQSINEAQFFGGENGLPDAGWQIDSIYVSADFDPDVTQDFDKNYSSALLPFNMGIAYQGEFVAPEFVYFPDLFFPPFFTNAPGIFGAKYLRSPIDPGTGEEVGLTMFTVHENPSSPGVQFRDPFGIPHLWRVFSGNIRPALGDDPCTFPDPKERRLCYLAQEAKDTRFLQASGPFSLGPGESQTVVIAQFAAATVETPLIVPGDVADNPPGVPSLRPGCGTEPIRPIEVGSGWISTQLEACTETTGVIDQYKVNFVPGSLLGKALVAQTIFDNKFLLGFAPEQADFALIPGSNQVTIIWQESATEINGDPFFSAAGDPANPLYNPNYRQFDVEGYRIYRGSDVANMQLIAQFDKNDTDYIDVLCETDGSYIAGDVCADTSEVNIISPFVQYAPGDVVRLEDLTPFITGADTAMAEGILSGSARLMDNSGIPFAFVDDGARNGFQYFYQVKAFDINSLASGPSTLESASQTFTVFPRAESSQLVLPSEPSIFIAGDDGVQLNTSGAVPALDANTGTFAGPFPPSDAFEPFLEPLVLRLLPAFNLTMTVDSVELIASGNTASGTQEFQPSATCPVIVPETGRGANPFGACWAMYLTVDNDGDITQEVVRGYNPWWSAFGTPPTVPIVGPRVGVSFDEQSLQDFGVEGEFGFGTAWDAITQEGINTSVAQGPQARRFGHLNGGSRWFDGDTETEPHPTQLIRVGHLAGVDTVWAPISHTPLTPGGAVPAFSFEKQCFNRAIAFLGRAADIRFTWSGGTFGEVRDVTHNVDVPFHPKAGTTWGFLTTDANANGVLDWQDFNYIDRAHQVVRGVDGGNCDEAGGGRWDPGDAFTPVDLVSTATLVPTSTEGFGVAGAAGLAQTGTGFGLFVNGERFIFETSSLPSDATVWTLREYTGTISTDDENAASLSGYSYTLDAEGAGLGLRPILIPGLSLVYQSEASTTLDGPTDLTVVHTVPDPYYTVSQYDLGPTTKNLRFVNLPTRATIRIYTVAGVLVDVINHDDPTGGGQATWDLRNRSNQFVASGVYFFHVVTPEGDERIGKFTIVNFAN